MSYPDYQTVMSLQHKMSSAHAVWCLFLFNSDLYNYLLTIYNLLYLQMCVTTV